MTKNRKIELLDCTLRDGGLGLEDAHLNGISNLTFSQEQIGNLIKEFKLSNIDIIELGAIEITMQDKSSFCIYQNIEDASELLPEDTSNRQNYTVLFRGPDTPLENIPNWDKSLCKFIRVIIRYSEIKKSLEFCEALSKKGYKVFIQPMVTTRYTEEELNLLIEYANKIDAYALYIVDSYGYMEEEELKKLYFKFDKNLKNNIAIGFHGHNNINLAFSNVKTLLNFNSERHLIIDCTLIGMGQGAGNVQTELLSYYLNEYFGKNYNCKNLLDGIEIIESFMINNLWGYSVVNLLPAVYKTAYKYSINLRNKFNLSYSEIDYILSNMPDEFRHRYTIENVETLLKQLNIKSKKEL
jgi:4-hydroxy 2-oxovalerate aldolase